MVLGFLASLAAAAALATAARFLLVTALGSVAAAALPSLSPPASALPGLRAAKTKLLVFLAPDPDLASFLPLVSSASLSRAAELRLRKEPFLLPVCEEYLYSFLHGK